MNELKSILIKYETTEWEFPKGRRNSNEDIKQCAIRELMEETNGIFLLYTMNTININFLKMLF